MGIDKYTYDELTLKLKSLGESINKESSMVVVGGYCMLSYGFRDSTCDIDCITDGFLIPSEFSNVINTDVINVPILRLSFSKLIQYSDVHNQYGKLGVHLASKELLLAMKFLAREGRMKQRDVDDLATLFHNANLKKAYEILCDISRINYDEDEFINVLRTEMWTVTAKDSLYDNY